ncbi:T9SS type A sorting domain-containing protein [uncultured Marixanthomonas sp.]|uniref:T9SS type A sorting domain-containing protein n=1 Tax=uncultured Marixanthomonas sp. TaxID=757245 RepID=UPI0030DC45F2|tara:strand:+ start:222299 stop:223780 length:1482 start_codon:yes stop_codon:yes gene_type:complete
MKKITITILLTLFTVGSILAQVTYTTPNDGGTYTLDDIATLSPSTVTVSGTDYTLLENLEISENDTFLIDQDLTLSIDIDLLITVFGAFNITADAATITAIDTANPYEGFRFEEFSSIDLQNTTIEYGGGLRVLTEDFSIDNCTLTNNVEGGAASGGVISLFRGTPQITNNTITFNALPAVSSGANSGVSPNISNNYLEGNNQSNSNRPQINLGITNSSDTLRIIQNTIIGDRSLDMVGGIAVANFFGGAGNILARIDDNTIVDNRYGMNIVGTNSFAYVTNNIIEDNDTQGLPNSGGSGISLNSSSAGMEVIASGNEFRRNLWGITVIGEASINLGDDEDNPGENVFSENGNGGEIYALYNNTANTLQAKNNCWIEGQESDEQQVEDVIFHVVDDSTLGEVIFNPFLCAVLSIEDNTIESFSFYPNPTNNQINFNNRFSFTELNIYNVNGKLVSKKSLIEGENTVQTNLPSGVYFARFSNESASTVQKLVIK